jgi:hypothetical protein
MRFCPLAALLINTGNIKMNILKKFKVLSILFFATDLEFHQKKSNST